MKKSPKKSYSFNKKTLFGSAFLLLGIFLSSTSYQFTGLVTYSNENLINYSISFIGIILVISGIFLIFISTRSQNSSLVKNQFNPKGVYLITQAHKDKSVGTYFDLILMAKKAGYKIIEGKNSSKLVRPDGSILSGKNGRIISIPRDLHVSRDIYLRLVKELSDDILNYELKL